MSTAAVAHSEYLGEILVRRGVVPADRVLPLFEAVKERGQALTDLLVQQKLADERQIAQALADECGLGFMAKIDLEAIPDDVAGRLPVARRVLVRDPAGTDQADPQPITHRRLPAVRTSGWPYRPGRP